MPKPIDASRFIPVELLVSGEENKFVHSAARGALEGEPGRHFFIKEIASLGEAQLEVLAQEFFRLIIPHQPETRIIEFIEEVPGDPAKTSASYFVLSEEARGYRPLPEGESVHFGDGTYTGLGQAVVCAMLLQEIDLKNGNIGLDERGRVIKIDGDWCFAPLQSSEFDSEEHPYTITSEGIESLPFPNGFYAFNWLDAIHEGTFKPESQLMAPELSKAPLFRKEVNEAILMLCLLPDELIEHFVKSYAPTETQEKLAALMKERLQQLRVSAAQTPSFIDYLTTKEAIEAKEKIIAQVSEFKIDGTPLLSPEKRGILLRIQIEKQHERLMMVVLKNECKRILEKLKSHDGAEDGMLHGFIKVNEGRVEKHADDLDELEKIREALEKVEHSLSTSTFKSRYRAMAEGARSSDSEDESGSEAPHIGERG
jgi:hypothetical protein